MQERSNKDTKYSINSDIRTCRKNLRLSESEEKTITEKTKAANTSFNLVRSGRGGDTSTKLTDGMLILNDQLHRPRG